MSDFKHAALPFKKDRYADKIYAGGTKGDWPICDIRGWGYLTGKGHGALGLSDKEAVVEQHAIAAFIVQACNAHDDLVAAAKAARIHLTTLGGDPRSSVSSDGSIDGDEVQAAVLDLIDAAIARATGDA